MEINNLRVEIDKYKKSLIALEKVTDNKKKPSATPSTSNSKRKYKRINRVNNNPKMGVVGQAQVALGLMGSIAGIYATRKKKNNQ